MMEVDYSNLRMELDEALDDMEAEKNGKQDYDDGEFIAKDKERSRESGKHKSKDKKKSRHGERDHGNKDQDRSKEGGREDLDGRDSGRHGSKEGGRLESRERRKEEREHEKERDRDKERSRDKAREKDYEREKYREKDREHERDEELDRERSYDRDRERGRDRGREIRDRGRDREKDRDVGRERDVDREYERGRERDKSHDHIRHRDRDRERERDGDRDHDRSKVNEKDRERDVDRGLERERGKEKDRDRVKDREREREKDRDKAKEREKEKEKNKDREKMKEKEKDKERDKSEREKGKEKHRDKEVDKDLAADRDKSRGRDMETETARSREGKMEEKAKVDVGEEDHGRKSVGFHEPSSELEERLKKMKEERLKRKSDAASEILSWVDRSRKLEDKRNAEKEKALRISKALEEQDNILAENEDEEGAAHSGKDLAGVKILHGLDKVIEGGAVVLTLKDQSILAGGDINEEVDVLENVEIGEQKQRDEAYKAAKRKTGIYDDKFNDDMGSQKTILPQYDDPIEDEGVTLDEGGRFTGEAEKKLEELRKRIAGGSLNKNYENLTTSGKMSSDYFTPDEMLQFKKPKKKKSLRKKEKLDLDALEAEAISAGLGTADLGSRSDLKRQSAKEEREKAEAESRSSAYQAAYAKAEEASKVLRLEQTLTVKAAEDDDLVFGEDYEDLQKSMEQARKLVLKKKDEAAASGPQAVALLATAKKDQGDNQETTVGELEENKVVITEMEEFVLGLQLNEDSRKPESEDVFKDEEDAPNSSEQETEGEAGGWMEVMETNKEDEQPISEEKEDVSPDEIIHEAAVGKGLSGALKLLKDRGTLKESIDWGGRNMDKKKSKLVGLYDTEGPKEIRIERTDEFGRIMTPKEAFRMISHKFHGKGPGKMKQEKRMKQYQEDLKTKQMKASDTPLLAMERMREAQARLKTPYLVLSGHVKPGQTSDPNSGFATVEKDHLGSLTPMLGDKKVEHFLGIKRKADAGSMGPPLPKKPKS